MIQNQSVRNRLRNELNVQLTDSNVIQTGYQIITQSRILKKQNLSNSDISIIHQLGGLDNCQSSYTVNNSNQYFINNQTPFTNHHNQFRLTGELNDSPLKLKNKIKSYRQELQVLNQFKNHQYTQTHAKPNDIKNRLKSTLIPQQSHKNMTKTLKNYNHNQIADIQQKISILPHQLQQKIKQNLQRKISSYHKNEPSLIPSPIKQSQFINNFDRIDTEPQYQTYTPNILQNLQEKSSFISPLNKQKFISINRQQTKSPKHITNSIIIQQNSLYKQKYQPVNLNLPTNSIQLNPRQKSTPRQNLLWNSIQLNRKSSKIKALSKSKQKQQSLSKNNKFSQLIQKRKFQFSEFQKQQTNKTPVKQFQIKESPFQISQQFNKSKIIKFYTEILDSLPKCKKCSNSYGALTLQNKMVTYACNQCDLKNKLQRSVTFLSSSSGQNGFLQFKWNLQKQSTNYNHPIIGALFDIENKLTNQAQMKTYNVLLKQISNQLQKIQQTKKLFIKLQTNIQNLKTKVRTNPKCIFEAKNNLKKLFSPQLNINSSINFDQVSKNNSIQKILPPEYLEQLDLWCKIKAQNFTKWPSIDEKLQILCPIYMKKNIKTIGQFLDPLLHNFQNNDIKISISQGLKLPVRSLGSATFIVDGSYNISPFDHIERLTLQFLNKRTFRQITSMMQNLPQSVQQLRVMYNHKLNSHISAQKYPILTKLSSIRSCKKLNAVVQNCKDEDDLLSSMKVMTKKKQLKITTTRSIYVRKPVIEATNQIKQMMKRLGKNIYNCQLNLAVNFDQNQIYKELMLTQRNKLMNFSLTSTLSNQNQFNQNKIFNNNNWHNEDILLNDFSVINDYSLNNSNMNGQTHQLNSNSSPKQHFKHKITKKWSALAVLKDSYRQKQLIDKYKNQEIANIQQYHNKHKSNHMLRLQILKMLI